MGRAHSPAGLGEKASPHKHQWPWKWLSWSSGGHYSWRRHNVPMPQAGSSSSSTWDVLSVPWQPPSLCWWLAGKEAGEAVTPPSHSSFKDASTHRSKRPYHGLQIAHNHIRQASAFSSCSLYPVISLLTHSKSAYFCSPVSAIQPGGASLYLLPLQTGHFLSPQKVCDTHLMSANNFELMRSKG